MVESATTIRGYRPGDERAIVALWNRCLPSDTISMERFAVKVLLDVNFIPEGFLVAEHDGQVVGFLLAMTRGTPMQGLDVEPEDGWITVFFVDPARRRRGIGQALLDRGRAYIAAQGRRWVGVSPYAPNYFWPGVDADRYPAALALLRKNGFELMEAPVSMTTDLVGYSVPEQVEDLQLRREQEGYAFSTLGYDQIAGVLDFNIRHFSADWARAVRDALLRGVSRDRVLVATREATVVGFCIYGGYDNVAERFGPFGVDPTLRRLGLGRILLHRCLERMQAEGLHNAWFLWTGPEDPAAYLYRSAGFTVSRSFQVLRAASDVGSR
jgi:ribosomal protein S18 acetylase RimI-like enzyme